MPPEVYIFGLCAITLLLLIASVINNFREDKKDRHSLEQGTLNLNNLCTAARPKMSLNEIAFELEVISEKHLGHVYEHIESKDRYIVDCVYWSTDSQMVVLAYSRYYGTKAEEQTISFVRDASVFDGGKFRQLKEHEYI